MRQHRIAITGASYAGKTTLARALMADDEFRHLIGTFIPEGARTLLRKLGYVRFDSMTREQLRDFQRRFFHWKQVIESRHASYLVDRSFVDVAAIWFERDTFDLPCDVQDELLVPCRTLAARYTLHVHLPFAIPALEDDGVRETDHVLHERIAMRIARYLDEWKLTRITLDSRNTEERVLEVKAALGLNVARPT